MDNMKNLKKMCMNSLNCLDNCYVNSAIVVILLLYTSELFENVNIFVGNLYHSAIVRIIVLLLIIFIAQKDTTIAILLAIAYIVSLHYKMSNENFVSSKQMNMNQVLGEEYSLQAMQHPVLQKIGEQELKNKQMMQSNPNNEVLMNKPSLKQKMENSKNKEHFFPLNSHGTKPNDFIVNPDTKENFFPLMNDNKDTKLNIQQIDKLPEIQVSNSNLNKNECLNNYTPRFEEVGDICAPTATFQNEFNAQGLNFPEGFDSAGMGSPL